MRTLGIGHVALGGELGRRIPGNQSDLELTLTEFPDPGGETVYLKVPVPTDDLLQDDELSITNRKPGAMHAAPASCD